MNYNKVMIAGNLTKDPETRATQSGTEICRFTLALNSKIKDVARTDYIECNAFGKLATTISKHFRKGKPIFVEGRFRQDTWQDNGEKKSRILVVVERFEFIDSLERTENAQNGANTGFNSSKGINTPEDEDVPF